MGKSGKRDGTRGTGPRTPICGSRLPASGALSVPDPSPAPGLGPEIGRRTPLTQRQAEPGTKVVGTAKAAAPCRGSGPRQGPRPPARPALLGRKLEAGRARLPQEKSGKVPPPPRAAPQPGHQGQVLTAPGFVSAQRTAQKCGTRRPGALPAGLTCTDSPRTPTRAAEHPAEHSRGHGRHLSFPLLSRPGATALCNKEGQREAGLWIEAWLVHVGPPARPGLLTHSHDCPGRRLFPNPFHR